jgi:hypothetical protein
VLPVHGWRKELSFSGTYDGGARDGAAAEHERCDGVRGGGGQCGCVARSGGAGRGGGAAVVERRER